MGRFGSYKGAISPGSDSLIQRHFDIPLLIKNHQYNEMIYKMKLYQLKVKYSSTAPDVIFNTILSASFGVKAMIIASQKLKKSVDNSVKSSGELHNALAIVGEVREEVIIKRQ